MVELCESIKALKLQLANFELYSSSPKEFRVWIGNAYPGRDKDWVEFGTFTYQVAIQTWPCYSGTLYKLICQVFASIHVYTGQITFPRKTQSCLTGHPVPGREEHPDLPERRRAPRKIRKGKKKFFEGVDAL